MDAELVDYYRRRAREYEAVYAKPERQDDLARLRLLIPERLQGRRVLEVACGTGYWTVPIAAAARSVLATDYAEEPMEIARAKTYDKDNVRFERADAYALGAGLGRFDAAFCGFWWSHVPRKRIAEFLASLHARLEPGARVLLLDNTFAEGSSTPIAGIDANGDTYQLRTLADGSQVRVMKNFPSEEEVRGCLAALAETFSYQSSQYYWLAEYESK